MFHYITLHIPLCSEPSIAGEASNYTILHVRSCSSCTPQRVAMWRISIVDNMIFVQSDCHAGPAIRSASLLHSPHMGSGGDEGLVFLGLTDCKLRMMYRELM